MAHSDHATQTHYSLLRPHHRHTTAHLDHTTHTLWLQITPHMNLDSLGSLSNFCLFVSPPFFGFINQMFPLIISWPAIFKNAHQTCTLEICGDIWTNIFSMVPHIWLWGVWSLFPFVTLLLFHWVCCSDMPFLSFSLWLHRVSHKNLTVTLYFKLVTISTTYKILYFSLNTQVLMPSQ